MNPEIEPLINRYLDEDLTAQEQAQLGEWIRADQEHANQFAEKVLLHDRLYDLSTSDLERVAMKPSAAGRLPKLLRHSRFAMLAIAASLLLVAGSVFWRDADRSDPMVQSNLQSTFATVVQTVDTSGSFSWDAGDRLFAQTVELSSGLARLRFDDGVEVTLEGPASYELVALGHTRLTLGRLAATVPPGAEGFRVETPSAEVVDLGTAFGVELSDTGDTHVSVFDGEVEVASAESSEMRKLIEGEAVRIQIGKPMEPVEFDGSPFEKIWPVASGIKSSSGGFRFLPAWPRRIRFVRSDQNIFVQPEGYRVRLSEPLTVNISEPGEYAREEQLSKIDLAAGTMVRSFVFHFHPEEALRRRKAEPINGVITFDRPVMGLIVLQDELLASRTQLSHRNSGEAHPRRQLELVGGQLGDTVSLSADRRTVKLKLASPGRSSDLLRIVVDASSDGLDPSP